MIEAAIGLLYFVQDLVLVAMALRFLEA